MGTENTSIVNQENLSNAKSLVHSKTTAASQAAETALQNSTNFLSQVGKNTSWGSDASKSTSATDAKSLQDFKNYVNDIRQSTGMNEAQAFEAALGAKIGTPEVFGISANASSNFSSNAARQKAIESAKAIADQSGYSENLERVISAAQSVSESENDTKSAELGQGALSSFNQAKSLRNEVSVAQNQMETLSREMSSSQSKNLTISKDLTQDVLEYIAHQPVNSGPQGNQAGQIGYEGARRILENGGEERSSYLKRFQEENPQYAIENINSAGAQEKFKHQYEGTAKQITREANIHEVDRGYQQEVLKRVEGANLNLNKTPSRADTKGSQKSPSSQNETEHPLTLPQPQDARGAVDSFIKQIDEKIGKRDEELSIQKEIFQEVQAESQKTNITGTALKNAGKSIIGDSSPANPIPFDKTPHNSPLYKK